MEWVILKYTFDELRRLNFILSDSSKFSKSISSSSISYFFIGVDNSDDELDLSFLVAFGFKILSTSVFWIDTLSPSSSIYLFV